LFFGTCHLKIDPIFSTIEGLGDQYGILGNNRLLECKAQFFSVFQRNIEGRSKDDRFMPTFGMIGIKGMPSSFSNGISA
jgi:hypothetical protein